MNCGPSRIKITVGEDKEFKIFLREEETNSPVDISSYTNGTVKFVNCKKEVISAAVPIPGTNPVNGEILVTLTPTETNKFDKLVTDLQLELTDGVKTKIIVLANKVEVIPQIY